MGERVRVIVTSNGSGEREEVVFTQDFEAKAEDWCGFEMSVDIDQVFETDNWPTAFPMEHTLRKHTL